MNVRLRRELLVSFAVLFSAAVLLAMLAVALVFPFLESPGSATLFFISLIAADLIVVFAFGSHILRRQLVEPVETMVGELEQIAGGDFQRRLGMMPNAELQSIAESVNRLADRLVLEQRRLAENVDSLEESNRELLNARVEVMRSARLASVGTLAAGIAHEVGNPLGAVIGYVDVARSRAEKLGEDTAILDSIREEAGRIDRIIRGVLDYARPREPEASAVDPASVLERVRTLLETQGKFEGVDTVWELDDDVAPVWIEPSRLEQVMVNLLLNSVDALEEEGSRIVVTLASEEGPGAPPPRRESDPHGMSYLHRRRHKPPAGTEGLTHVALAREVVVLRVEDDGPGIPVESIDRIFDPFFTTKVPGKGTGLGLSISARLVEGMGGAITVENRPSGGSVFTIRLPAYTPASPEEGVAEAEPTE